MAYNRKNKTLLIRDVQLLYLQHKDADVTVMRIYREYIFPRYRISRATFYNYLATPVRSNMPDNSVQLALF